MQGTNMAEDSLKGRVLKKLQERAKQQKLAPESREAVEPPSKPPEENQAGLFKDYKFILVHETDDEYKSLFCACSECKELESLVRNNGGCLVT